MLRLRIDSVAPGGDGVAHAEVGGQRRAVFVPGTVTGDVVDSEVDASRRPARGLLTEVLERGPGRVDPACAWSDRCGGCDWMHVAPDLQLELHVEHVRDAMPEAWQTMPIGARPSGERLGYRTRARVHVRCERGRVDVGMHETRTHEPVTVDRCVVLDPVLERARRTLAALFEGSRGRGDVALALGAAKPSPSRDVGAERAPVLDVRWLGELAREVFARLEAAVSGGTIAGARLSEGEVRRPAVVGDPTPWMTGADGLPLRLAPGGFAQASESTNVTLAAHVAELAAARPAERAIELHAGSGNLSVVLARAVGDLTTVESGRDACEAARANLLARGLKARIVEGDADAYAWNAATKLVVLDPPRTGARALAERLSTSPVARVIYVSCDPQTLGRDLGILARAYRPTSITVFEMFPQTSHVETVVALERARK
ncbi:MAG TPA: methyltransferase [Polyangiaceae bacterium]|nr:methyltransferase [Polyangiaceae bacterium]